MKFGKLGTKFMFTVHPSPPDQAVLGNPSTIAAQAAVSVSRTVIPPDLQWLSGGNATNPERLEEPETIDD